MQIVIDGTQMPNNCRECDSLGFSDLVGVKCPAYEFDKRPKGCPLTPLVKLYTLLMLSKTISPATKEDD